LEQLISLFENMNRSRPTMILKRYNCFVRFLQALALTILVLPSPSFSWTTISTSLPSPRSNSLRSSPHPKYTPAIDNQFAVCQYGYLQMSISTENDTVNPTTDGAASKKDSDSENISQISIDGQSSAIDDTSISALFKEKLFLGIEPTPEIAAIMSIYFVEGALGIARLAQTFFLKDTMHLGPAELSALTGLFTLPWTIKPLYGFLSDGLPLFGYRRRSYLVVCGFLGAFSYAAVGSSFGGIFGNDVGAMDSTGFMGISLLQASIASLVVSSGCIAFSDVVADGIVVQRTRDADDPNVAGGLQSLCWGSASIGALISAYFSGSLLETMSPTDVFSITAVLPLIVAAIAFFIDEDPVEAKIEANAQFKDTNPSVDLSTTNGIINCDSAMVTTSDGDDGVKQQIASLWSAIKQPAVWKPALFLFLWQSTPTSEGAFLYFMTNDLGMGPEFLGRVRLVTAAASLAGVWGYQKYLRAVAIKDILFWTTVASAPLGLIQLLLITHANRSLGIPDGAFVFGDDVVLAVLGEFAFLPTLVLAAKICPPGVEAVLFATLMSIFNGASTVGTEVGALLTKILDVTENNFDNLGLLNIICNLTSLYPLLFIGLLDGVGTKSEADIDSE